MHGVLVGFLAEMEVRGHGVLEEMDEEVAAENQERSALALADRDREHVNDGRRKHEAGAEANEIAKDEIVPVTPRNQDEAARDVRERRDQAEEQSRDQTLSRNRSTRCTRVFTPKPRAPAS